MKFNNLINFNVPDDELNQLDLLCKSLGVCRSTLLRKSIKILWCTAEQVRINHEKQVTEFTEKLGKFDHVSQFNAVQNEIKYELNSMSHGLGVHLSVR